MHTMIKNPILTGFHPDPSICRAGDDFYIATSTFEWFPGVEIWHSRDLVHWEFVTRPLARLSQLDMKGNPDSCGVWAPNLTWHDGLFYLVYTDVKTFDGRWKDTHNYLVTAPSIEGPWSDPVFLNDSGFDPSLFHDDDGRAYVVNMLVDHRQGKFFGGIVLQEYSYAEQRLIGDVHYIFAGSPLGVTEGPVLMKRDGWYYLITAEGGTEYAHAVSMARSRSITGPYEIHPQNPVLTALDAPGIALQKAGHGSVVETPSGEWYLSHLTGRPLTERGRCPLGRETCLQRVEWHEDGWLYLSTGGHLPQTEVPAPALEECPFPVLPTSHEFDGKVLPSEFQSLRIPMQEDWISLEKCPGYLALKGQESLCSTHTQSLIARRQQDFCFEASTCLHFEPENFQQMAGLTYYYNTRHFYYLFLSWDEHLRANVLSLYANDDNRWSEPLGEPLPVEGNELWLKAEVRREKLQFFYSEDGENWTAAGGVLDASIISDDYVCKKAEYKAAFTGAFIGMCCQDLSGKGRWAYFKNFNYQPLNQ